MKHQVPARFAGHPLVVALALVFMMVPGNARVARSGMLFGRDDYKIVVQAHSLAEQRQFSQAEDLLKALLRSDEQNREALSELATILSWDGRYDESVASYRRLLVLKPEDTGIHLEIGKVLLWQADRTGNQEYRRAAIKEFESALTTDSSGYIAIKQIGAAYFQLGEVDTAYRVLSSLHKLWPDDDETMRLLAQTCVARQDLGEAVPLMRELVKRFPGNPDLRWELADVLMQAGELDLAEKEFQTVLAKFPFHSASRMGLAQVRERQGRTEDAKGLFQSAALWASIKNPAPFLGLGNVEAAQGHWRTAVDYYRKAATVDPGNELAEANLRQAQWTIGPAINTGFTQFNPSQGLGQRIFEVEASMNLSDWGTWAVGYKRGQFMQESVPDLLRKDFSISWTYRVAHWLTSKLHGIVSDYSENPNDSRKLFGWSADLVLLPLPSTRLYLTYARTPATDSYATINSQYYSDVFAVGLDADLTRRLSIQANGSLARYHGSFTPGYWDWYHSRWILMEERQDKSRHQHLEGQISYKFSFEPVVTLSAGASTVKTINSIFLPYWAPLYFPTEKIALTVARSTHKLFNYSIEGRITHVHEGTEWGGGLSALFTFRLLNFVEVGASGSVEQMGTHVPWDGNSIGAVLRIHYSEW